jgi:redox-sensitive bicupin YhaK (pirin superfamily)
LGVILLDTKGNQGILGKGDCQWMTAAKGVCHAEMPHGKEVCHSLQLWLNLPNEKKMTEPRYQDLRGETMATRKEQGVVCKIISGSSGNVKSDTKNVVPVTAVHIFIEPNSSFEQDIPADYNGFIYLLEGSGTFGENSIKASKCDVVLTKPCGSSSEESLIKLVNTGSETLEVIFFSGRPIGEKVYHQGPFVLGSEKDLKQAFADYYSGNF